LQCLFGPLANNHVHYFCLHQAVGRGHQKSAMIWQGSIWRSKQLANYSVERHKYDAAAVLRCLL
jgi:hypothetical protein